MTLWVNLDSWSKSDIFLRFCLNLNFFSFSFFASLSAFNLTLSNLANKESNWSGWGSMVLSTEPCTAPQCMNPLARSNIPQPRATLSPSWSVALYNYTGWPRKKTRNGILPTGCGWNNWYQSMRYLLLRKMIPWSQIWFSTCFLGHILWDNVKTKNFPFSA